MIKNNTFQILLLIYRDFRRYEHFDDIGSLRNGGEVEDKNCIFIPVFRVVSDLKDAAGADFKGFFIDEERF